MSKTAGSKSDRAIMVVVSLLCGSAELGMVTSSVRSKLSPTPKGPIVSVDNVEGQAPMVSRVKVSV